MSNRINGARVKAAARVHASKQLRNLGFDFPEHAGSAKFSGDTAYAQWMFTYDGRITRFGINYPALPDNAMLSRREADLIAAYTLHELGHIAFTDNRAASGIDRLLFRLWNGIEDARIEHAVIQSGKARGARTMFKKLMSKYTTTHLGESFNPTSINSAPFALALVCRAAYGDGNGFAKTLLARIPAPHQAWYAQAAAGMASLSLDRDGSAGALRLAQDFLAAWQAQFPEAFNQPQPQQPEPEQQQLSDEDESQDDDDFDDEDGDDEFSLGDRSDPYDDELDDGFGDEDDGEGSEEQLAKQLLEQEIAESSEPSPSEGDDSLFAGSDDDSDSESGGSGEGADLSERPFDPVENDKYDENKVLQPEPNVDEVFKSARERTKGAVDLPARAPAPRSHMSKWRNMVGKDDAAIRRAARKLHKAALPALKAQLYRILKAPEICGWDSGALGGRFDGKRAPRMFAGSEQVFKRRWLSEGIDTAVSIVVDLSGSMAGESIRQAVDLAYTVAEACESARADVEVLGFRSNTYNGSDGHYGSSFSLDGEYQAAHPSSMASLVVAKSFKEKLAKVAHHFAFLKQCAGGGTPDYPAIKTVCEQLSQLPHQRKVVIVITDGFGEAAGAEYDELGKRIRTNYLMRKLGNASHELYGCDVIGFGIYCNAQEFADAYPIGAPVGLHNLHKTALKGVIKQLESRDLRRVA